jgi:hypothetical protein
MEISMAISMALCHMPRNEKILALSRNTLAKSGVDRLIVIGFVGNDWRLQKVLLDRWRCCLPLKAGCVPGV